MSASLFETLVSVGLMTAEEVEAALAEVPESEQPLTEAAFARRLVADERLTQYQVDAILKGQINDLVLGNYVVIDRLGAGGMGTVFKARHRRMKRLVALKLLHQAAALTAGLVDRFQREVEAIAQLIHPNIVTAFDADEGPLGPFLVMEYIEGSDLAELVHKGGPLSIFTAVDAILQAARGLECAHAKGIIHRDIKPGNLLRDKRGTIKVTDLGLAWVNEAMASDAAPRHDMTLDGSVFGTVDFMSPEQALNSKNADHRSDIYSLGCTLHYLLTAKHIFDGESILEKILAHRENPLPPLNDVRPDVPDSVVAVFRKMVAKKPADRFQTMTQVIHGLEGCKVPSSNQIYLRPASATRSEPGGQERPSTAQPATAPITLVDLSVLLIEPSRVQAMVIQRHLQSIGLQRIQMCGDAAAAIEAMHASPIDLVISAMHLPDLTGAQLVERMRADPDLEHVGFILISSETDDRLIEPIRQSGAVAILPKPFGAEQLKRAVLAGIDFVSPGAVSPSSMISVSLRVLIADDSAAARNHMRRVLENIGVRDITHASNGHEAVAKLQERQFDLLVTDFHMPEMDGRELVAYIRRQSNQPNLPVLMVTSETDHRQLAAAERAGVSAVCNKVFEPKNVRKILEKILAR